MLAANKQDLIAAVAYALWEDRKRHNRPEDPIADWCRAEELITELCRQLRGASC
jgi:hypothetical protein